MKMILNLLMLFALIFTVACSSKPKKESCERSECETKKKKKYPHKVQMMLEREHHISDE